MHTNDRKHTPFRIIVAICVAIMAASSGCAPEAAPKPQGQAAIFFPAPPETPRVQFLCSLTGAKDFAEPESGFADLIIGKRKEKYSTLAKPYGIAVREGKVFVTDTKALCVAVMNFNNETFKLFGMKGRGTLRKPINIRMDPSGRCYVTDTDRSQVVVFDNDGKYVAEYGRKGHRPSDVIVSGEDMFVLDIGSHSIKVFDLKTGKLKRSFGGRGKKPGEFNYPTNMVMDAKGFIYVCDSMNFRVQKLDQYGKAYLQFGAAGRTPGHFARPRGIAVDRNGLIYVADAVMGIVQIFDRTGKPLMHFGENGEEPGRLLLPAQVTINYDSVEQFRKYVSPGFEVEYLIFVTNQIGPNKVSVFAFGLGKGSAATQPGGDRQDGIGRAGAGGAATQPAETAKTE